MTDRLLVIVAGLTEELPKRMKRPAYLHCYASQKGELSGPKKWTDSPRLANRFFAEAGAHNVAKRMGCADYTVEPLK